MFILLFVFPGALPTGPIYNWIAVLSMLLGVFIPFWIAKRRYHLENLGNYLKDHVLLMTVVSTTMGIVLRVLVMTAVNYFALPQDYPIGFSFEEFEVLVFLPIGGAFNAIVAAYSILIAVAVTVALTSRIRIE
jgi:hypothetical protein